MLLNHSGCGAAKGFGSWLTSVVKHELYRRHSTPDRLWLAEIKDADGWELLDLADGITAALVADKLKDGDDPTRGWLDCIKRELERYLAEQHRCQ